MTVEILTSVGLAAIVFLIMLILFPWQFCLLAGIIVLLTGLAIFHWDT